MRAVALGILKRSGYHVIVARDANEAVRLCERHPDTVHLLVTDVVMPQMSGAELASRLAETRPEMRVLCMSENYADDSIVRHGVLAPVVCRSSRSRSRRSADPPSARSAQRGAEEDGGVTLGEVRGVADRRHGDATAEGRGTTIGGERFTAHAGALGGSYVEEAAVARTTTIFRSGLSSTTSVHGPSCTTLTSPIRLPASVES